MKGPDSPPIDWDSIFSRAHRHIASRLLLLGAVTTLVTLLLLGGGLSAQGAISLTPEASKEEKRKEGKPDGTGTRPGGGRNGGSGGGKTRPGHDGKRDKTGIGGGGPPQTCTEPGGSGGTEYLDAPPNATKPTGEECVSDQDSGTGGTDGEEDDTSPPSDEPGGSG